MTNRSGYTPIAQSIDEEEEDVGTFNPGTSSAPSTNTRGLRRAGRPGSIDLKKLDTAFKRWTESIAQKVKRKKKVGPTHERKQIWHSVFEPQVIIPGVPTATVKTLDHKPPMTQEAYDGIIQSIKSAIAEGIHPKMITKGSSGSYFARAKVDGRVQTVAVFKPKDEEPYGRLNPKTTKWIHRQFRWIIPFGRACLIPNLSYISEAAASLLDDRLSLHIVPPTKLVSLSSPAFFYDWIDRSAAKKGKPLPEKIGSMQYFLHGFQDASDFLRKHPWPGRAIADTFDDSSHRQRNFSKRFLNTIKIVCGRTGDTEDIYDDGDYDDERILYDASESNTERPFYWSQTLQKSFREELEKLVILDYLMLNTDRGADNYMIKYCEGDHEKTLVDVAPSRSVRKEMPVMSELRREASSSAPSMTTSSPYFASPIPTEHTIPTTEYTRTPHIHIAAIDNSLSFPHEHPQGWRSYTYGWLYLPVSIIGRPFSEKTRSHFLPLLTSKAWWEETSYQLEKLFAFDPDFHPKMFRRQLAVIKGQAWNIVQSLKHSDEGPLELTRRKKALVWDDELEISEDLIESQIPPGASPSSPRPSVSSVPLPQRTRRYSSSSDFPPPVRRTSTEGPRPVSFATKFQRVHPGTTGVTVLEHLERLDAVEASLQRLGADETVDEEVDVGVTVQPVGPASAPPTVVTSPFSPPGSPLPTVHEVSSSASSIAEEDVAAMSKSMSYAESPAFSGGRHGSSRGLEWIQTAETTQKRTVVAERMEIINKKPLCRAKRCKTHRQRKYRARFFKNLLSTYPYLTTHVQSLELKGMVRLCSPRQVNLEHILPSLQKTLREIILVNVQCELSEFIRCASSLDSITLRRVIVEAPTLAEILATLPNLKSICINNTFLDDTHPHCATAKITPGLLPARSRNSKPLESLELNLLSLEESSGSMKALFGRVSPVYDGRGLRVLRIPDSCTEESGIKSILDAASPTLEELEILKPLSNKGKAVKLFHKVTLVQTPRLRTITLTLHHIRLSHFMNTFIGGVPNLGRLKELRVKTGKAEFSGEVEVDGLLSKYNSGFGSRRRTHETYSVFMHRHASVELRSPVSEEFVVLL
ncbi:hypothetical protein H0H81_002561 [Sphagnurus paluster]|uniref:1-phosphatidylinositol 4-kinase n=1 Tax=Sphagnurus paluster TaxID=117069 RepID=A0A9P7GNE9_9AGAR|nr:hypothetical protein H0H81_002561 [Sphagnurus paluster]